MINKDFVLAFKVDVFHSYFDQGICNCLEFSMRPITQHLLIRFDCKIRHRTNGFDFFINSKNDLPVFFEYVKNATNEIFFGFEIRSNNPDFFFLTAFPTDWVGQVIYNSQANSNLLKDNIVKLDEKLSEKKSTSNLGEMILYFDDILKFRNDKGFAHFNIQFKARATQWQYFIINKSALLLNNPAIVGQANFTFEKPEMTMTETGEQALMFSSGNNLFPFSERPIYRFDLVNYSKAMPDEAVKNTSICKVLIKGLPNPAPKGIKTSGGDAANHIFSPMYVYI